MPVVQYRMDRALKPDTYEKARRTGIRILLEPRLAPGLYQLRVGVAQVGRRSGSVVYDLEVPDFAKAALVLSGVSLTSVETSAQRFSAGRNLLTDALPEPITSTRQFSASDRISVYAEVYDNIADASPHPVIVRAEMRTAAGDVVRSVADKRSSALMNHRQTGFVLELPLSGVTSGSYVLHFEAIASVKERSTRRRDIPIVVH